MITLLQSEIRLFDIGQLSQLSPRHEAKIKELETLLYPSRLKQATVEAQKKIRAELLRSG